MIRDTFVNYHCSPPWERHLRWFQLHISMNVVQCYYKRAYHEEKVQSRFLGEVRKIVRIPKWFSVYYYIRLLVMRLIRDTEKCILFNSCLSFLRNGTSETSMQNNVPSLNWSINWVTITFCKNEASNIRGIDYPGDGMGRPLNWLWFRGCLEIDEGCKTMIRRQTINPNLTF